MSAFDYSNPNHVMQHLRLVRKRFREDKKSTAVAAAAEAALSAKLHVSIPVVAEDDSDVAAAAAAFALEAERGTRGAGLRRDTFRDSKRQVTQWQNLSIYIGIAQRFTRHCCQVCCISLCHLTCLPGTGRCSDTPYFTCKQKVICDMTFDVI
jgi:hypothetical protein